MSGPPTATPLPGGPTGPAGTAPPVRKPGPPVAVGVLLIVASVVLAVVSVVKIVGAVADVFTSRITTTPATLSLDAEPGTYAVYELADPFFGTSELPSGELLLTPGDVRVTGPDGREVATERTDANEEIGRNGRTFVPSVRFEVDEAGRYTVDIAGPETEVLVGRTIGSSFARAAVWLVGLSGAALVFFAGVVLLIVTAVRRSRAREARQDTRQAHALTTPTGPVVPYGGAGPAPGWYPDPWDTQSLRWHDGSAWTGSTAPRPG